MTDPNPPAPPPNGAPQGPVVRTTRLGEMGVEPGRNPLRPWEPEWPEIPRPLAADYGFFDGKEAFGTDREGLETLARHGRVPPGVWTPDTPSLVRPEEIPWLLQPLRDRLAADARAGLMVPAIVVGVVLFSDISQSGGLRFTAGTFLMLAFASVWAGWRLWSLWRARRMTPAQFRDEVNRAHYAGWLRAQPALYTKLLLGLIAAGLLVQFPFQAASIDVGAMINVRALDGEWWRLGTSAFLHYGLAHAAMNGLALWLLGRETEAQGASPYLPLVFLASAVGGNLLGLALADPERAALGASGGVLGVVGFLLVVGFRRQARLPAGYLGLLMADVGIIALVGAVGYAFIDNAGHLGGLATGLALGALLVPRGEVEWRPGPVARGVGMAAAAVCVAIAAAVVILTLLAGTAAGPAGLA